MALEIDRYGDHRGGRDRSLSYGCNFGSHRTRDDEPPGNADHHEREDRRRERSEAEPPTWRLVGEDDPMLR